MAPPKPKTKPRTELARASARASKWAFGTKGLSEKQEEAALKNYRYIQTRLRETGGTETERELEIGKSWLAKPKPPPPRPRAPALSPDAEDRGAAARSRNAARGAAPTGGAGRLERTRAMRAFQAPPKKRPQAILRELRRAGYNPASNEEAQRDVADYLGKLQASEKASYLQAAKDPFNVKRNTQIVGLRGAQSVYKAAREHASQQDPMRPALKPKPNWAEKIVEQGASGIGADPALAGLGDAVPWFRESLGKDIKELAVESMLGIPAIAEAAYNDATGKTRWGLAKIAKEGVVEWGKILERAIPVFDPVTAVKASVAGSPGKAWDVIKKDVAEAGKQWSEKPATTAINVVPAANAAARVGGFATLAARMARLNPELPRHVILNAARKESYVPGSAARKGIKGGIPDRVFTGRILDDEGELLGDFQTAPIHGHSRTPIGRAGQRIGLAMGKEVQLPGGRSLKITPLSETARAANALKRKRGLDWERQRVAAIQLMAPVTDYVKRANIPSPLKERYLNTLAEHRTRLAETFYGPQAPDRLSPHDALSAVVEDLKAMRDDGGIEIPTRKLAAIDKELDKLDNNLDRLGLGIDTGTGLWAEAQDVMRQAGRSEPEIRTNLELMKGRARVWARSQEGRDPQDWIESPDGRDVAGFVHGEPDVELGAVDEGGMPIAAQPRTLAQAVGRAGPHIPNVQLPEARLEANLAAKTSGRSKATGVPETPDLRTSLDGGPEFQLAGDVTPEAWLERANALVPDITAQENLARWYEHYVPMFRRAFGKDANAVMRGFAVSQANASPASGLSSVLRVMDGVREGKNITKKGYGSVVAENIGKAVRDGEIDSFIAAKLSDFIDSLEGRSTRRWMKDHPDAGAPAAVDVHAIRDRGFVDEKLIARMKSVHGYELDKDYIIEGTGAASGGKYERIAEWYQEVTDHLNDVGHNGRKDWTPAQTQALGWSVIQLAHKTVPEGFAEAFAYNTRAITFEVTKGPGGLGSDLSLPQSRKAAKAMLGDARQLIKDTPGLYLVDAKVGTGGWNQGANANITLRVMGSKAKVQEALTTIAQAFDQEWVQATREVSGANSRATIVATSPRFKTPATAVKFFTALNRINPDLQGFVAYDVNGVPGLAIRTGSPSVSPKTQKAFVERHRAAIEQAEAETGIEVTVDARNMEMLTGGQHGEVAPVQTLPGSGRGLGRAELDDPGAARIREKLEGVVAEAGGTAPRPEGAGTAYPFSPKLEGEAKAARTAETEGFLAELEARPVRGAAPRTLYQADPPFPGEMKGYETRIPVLVHRETGRVEIGRPGDTHGDMFPDNEDILDQYFQTQIMIDPTDGKVLYTPNEIPLSKAQAEVDAYMAIHYPNGVGGNGPRMPETTSIERHEITEPSTWGHEGTARVPWIYDPDSGILHIGTPGSDHGQLSRKVYDKYGYNQSLNREWIGIWAPTSQRVVLHGNETGDMPSPDFPVDPRLGPVIQEAFGKKLKHWDHESGEIIDAPEDSGLIGSTRQNVFHQREYKAQPELDTDERIRQYAEHYSARDKDEMAATFVDEDEAAFPGSWEEMGFDRGAAVSDYLHTIDEFERQHPELFEAKKGTEYWQSEAGGVRGAVEFIDSESGRQLVYLSEKANASTFAHELFGHAAGEMKREYPKEFAALEKRYGKPYEQWDRAEHERLARETERYLMRGKAPTPELQPIFDQMRAWMYEVYETIKALGRPMPAETRQLLDRYFGKEPLDFTPPKRLRRGLPNPGDLGAIDALIEETSDLLSHGPAVLKNDPANAKRIAGNMKWLEEQVLPYLEEMDTRAAARLEDLFKQFEEVRSGDTIFAPEQAAAIARYGELTGQRARQLEKAEDRLAAQPDIVKMQMARDVMDALDDPDIDLEGLYNASRDLDEIGYEFDQKTKFDDERQKLLSRQIADIERALDPRRTDVTKAQRDEAINAMREISEQNEKIFLDVFGEGMNATEKAALKRSLDRRSQILSRRLKDRGLVDEGSGDGVFVPHYSIFDVLQSRLRGAVRLPAAGASRKTLALEPRKTKGAFSKGSNRLIRYQTGELAVTPQALLSQYMQRMRFAETASLRKELFDLGVRIPSSGRVPQGWYIINGTKTAIPERLRALRDMSDEQIDELLAAGEDIDAKISTDDGLTKTLQEYRDQFLHNTKDGPVPDSWDGDRMRMVPPEIVERMVGKVFESAPGGHFAASVGLASLMARFSTIYAHAPGYIGANVAANTVMLGATKPGSLLRGLNEFAKGPGTLRRKHPELYDEISVEGGDPLAQAGLPDFYVKEQNRVEGLERKATEFSQRWATGLGDIADQPFRVAAWLGEARREGFTNPEQWRELLRNPELETVRNNVAQRTRENMIDFNKLSDGEKRMARFVFIWPFMRGAVKWPFWFASEYPGRAAVLANLARAQEQAYGEGDPESVRERYNRAAPASERTMFDLFQLPLAGGRSVNLSPIHPLGPLAEKVEQVGKLAGGDPTQIADILNPAFRTGGAQIFGDRGFDAKALAEVTVPYYSYVRAAQEPRKRGAQIYTDRDSFWDYIRRREVRFTPEDVDYEKVVAAKEKEDSEADKSPAWEKNTVEDIETVDKVFAAAAAAGKPVSAKGQAAVKKSVTAYHSLDKASSDYADELGINEDDLSELQLIEATERVAREFFPEASRDWIKSREAISRLPEKKRGEKMTQYNYRMWLREKIQQGRSLAFEVGRNEGVITE